MCLLQHNGAPLHFSRKVTEFLNDSYHSRWLGIGGPVPWPLRLPALSPLVFFVWGCLKSRVYHSGKPETQQQFVQVINKAGVGIRNELEHMQRGQSVEQCVAACLQVQDAHFEQWIKSCTHAS
jgi:hypothetical protein